MATMAYDTQSPRRAGLLMLVVVVLVVGVLSLMRRYPTTATVTSEEVELPELSAHARLHADAGEARDWVQQHGRFCRYNCPDGRTRYVCGMPKNRWAIVVVEGTGIVTSFTASQEYARGITDACTNPWHYVHP